MKTEGARPAAQRSGRKAMRDEKDSSVIVNRSSLAKARLLVVGDVMLDRYWFGDVARISPEAPVPVVRIDRIEERPGGAANVARNAAALGTAVSLLSVIGADEAGTRLKRLLGKERIAVQLHRDRSVATTIKLRVIGRRQQLLRVDFEKTPSHEVLASKLKDFGRMLRSADAVILSDYGKGGLAHISRMIGMARQAGKPVLVDPKGEDYSRYRGATMITPNRAEFRQVVGGWTSESELTRKAQQLRRRLGLAALLITRSEEGMTLYQAGQRLHVAAQAREVYDVSGAGDTVIATLGTMLAGGAGIEDAVRVANRAAGIVVGKFGTAVVYPEELFGKDERERSVST
jgi:rfaE bifunctional protein kinase chain/domain